MYKRDYYPTNLGSHFARPLFGTEMLREIIMNNRKKLYMNIAFKDDVQKVIEEEAVIAYKRNVYDVEELKTRRQEIYQLLEEWRYDLPFSTLQEAKVFLEFSLRIIAQKVKKELIMRVNQKISNRRIP